MGANGSVEQRLQALEDQIAIYQVICGYGYAVDGLNYDGVRDLLKLSRPLKKMESLWQTVKQRTLKSSRQNQFGRETPKPG